MIRKITVCGAGTMGSGIAQVCAQSGMQTILYDINEAFLTRGLEAIRHNLQSMVEKQKIDSTEKENVLQRIHLTTTFKECQADLVIEAIAENTEKKINLFQQLTEINGADVIFATNTSSLSVSEIQQNITHPGRVVGMHFFNPAQYMKLVEVIKGRQTSDEVVQEVFSFCSQLGKTPVICKDSPGFIVNRVARHFYLQALKLVETRMATYENIDRIMEATGFKMGPFKLMDLIGLDINLSVSESLFEGFNNAMRFKPSPIQLEKVRAGELGRKTGKGFYTYSTEGK